MLPNDIYNRGRFTTCLKTIIKELRVKKMNKDNKIKVVIVGNNINFSARELEETIRKEWGMHGLKQNEIIIKNNGSES